MATLLGHDPRTARDYSIGDLETMIDLYYENLGVSIR